MVTQQQIARKLGISRQLVTFALAGYPQVSRESRELILTTARKMGYRPNPHARALKRGRTGIIALWVPDQISSHYMHVAQELNRLVKQKRHELIITEIGNGTAEQILTHVPVDGIIAVDAPDAVRAHLRSSAALNIPVVSIGANCFTKTDFVRVDLATGTRAMMKHLLDSGFRKIAHATFFRDNKSSSRRAEYLKAMRKAGLKPEFIHYPLSEKQREIVRRQIQEYVRKQGLPEAIFCHSDDVAIGIYRGLCDAKIQVPEQIAVAGCDGIQDTEYLETPLTTIVQPVAEMCVAAWKLLVKRLEQPKGRRQEIILMPALAVRESSQPL